MNKQLLSPLAQKFEGLLDRPEDNYAKQRVRELASQSPAAQQLRAATYDLVLVRRHDSVGDEVFSQRNVPLGKYSEHDLYGEKGSPVVAFKNALDSLHAHAERIIKLEAASLEYTHQVTLFWANSGRLKTFLGVNSAISELVAEVRTARFQFIGKDTPAAMIRALAAGLKRVIDAPRMDSSTVDCFVETLEAAGFDSLVIDANRHANGDRIP